MSIDRLRNHKLVQDNVDPETVAIAIALYERTQLAYHNIEHIVDCLDYLEKTHASPAVVKAMLYHDCIYDDKPKKERRSADVYKALFPDCQLGEACIMATETHKIDSNTHPICVYAVKADLWKFIDPIVSVSNFSKIMQENQTLYGLNDKDAATASYKFLTAFRETMKDNYFYTKDEFWKQVLKGVDLSASMAQIIMKTSD